MIDKEKKEQENEEIKTEVEKDVKEDEKPLPPKPPTPPVDEEEKSEPNEAEQPKEVEKDETDYKAKFEEVSQKLEQLTKTAEVNEKIKDSGLENHSETVSHLLRNSDDISKDLENIKKLMGSNENKVKDSLNVKEKDEVKKDDPINDREMGKRVGGLF